MADVYNVAKLGMEVRVRSDWRTADEADRGPAMVRTDQRTTSAVTALATPYRLADRYTTERGTVFLTGIQALARIPFDQLRADRRTGLHTAAFVSGYPGSPLGSFDRTIAEAAKHAPDLPVVARPALNEEYAATAVMGSQLANARPDARYDGVVGVWYGKAPGVDRASDALRHAAFAGTWWRGGAVALVGDDPAAKSSTVPSSSAGTLADMNLPLLYPADPGEALDLGLHAVAMSRATGLWVALKIVADVADGTATVDLDPDRVQPIVPLIDGRPYQRVPEGRLLTPVTLELEREIVEIRQPLVIEYAALNRLNDSPVDPTDAWIGIVASGITYREVREAFSRLGLHDDCELVRCGIRLLKMRMPLPFDQEGMRSFARGLEEVLVIEEKHPNIETLIKDVLYPLSERPLVVGKLDEAGSRLVPGFGALDADAIVPVLRRRLTARLGERLRPAAPERTRLKVVAANDQPTVARAPFYCSGCPHNRSTEVPPGTLVGAGIGCHTMALLMDPERVGDIAGVTVMGNEGTQWIGMSSFVQTDHMVQNIGDGTYFHSGQLAVQAAVAAGVNITYKLLHNGAVAMTGGQHPEGQIGLAEIARTLLDHGVREVLITTEDPERVSAAGLPKPVRVWDRTRLLEAQEYLAGIDGVTVLIHDQACAAELRRARKRGLAPTPPQRVLINERICEGCGDCGRKSNCLSLHQVDTPFGRKTMVDQTTCNLDYSCIEGDCPSFITVSVVPDSRRRRSRRAARARRANDRRKRPAAPATFPEPSLLVPRDDFGVRITGVGGTGVVTVAQILGTAAMLDGYHVRGLDQTGLSQKAGPVVSDVRLSRHGDADTSRLGGGQADLLLATDLLVAASEKGRSTADSDRTVVVGSTSEAPVGAMITHPEMAMPSATDLIGRLQPVTRDDGRFADADAITSDLFGDATSANFFLVGMAVQHGALPITAARIEQAIELNGVAVDVNVAAFRWGRCQVSDPGALAAARQSTGSDGSGPQPCPISRQLLERLDDQPPELHALLHMLVVDLCDYQDEALAARFLDEVDRVRVREQEVVPGSTRLTEAVARSLQKLMAYKDEYEVARLLVAPGAMDKASELAADGGRVRWHLHPPVLRALGLHQKIAFPVASAPVFRALARGRRLRGTLLDPFRWTAVRRVERRLPGEFLAAVHRITDNLTAERLEDAVRVATLPQEIRGYEQLKLERVARFRAELAELSAAGHRDA